MPSRFDAAIQEIAAVLARVDESAIEAVCASVAAARKIVVYGVGREGLMLRALAMRLHHMGAQVQMQGDMSAPPLGAGDLFICSAGPGDLPTVRVLMEVARAAEARVLLLTAEPEAPLAALASLVLLVPAQTMARGQGAGASQVLPMGSAYEGALFFLGEMIILRLREALGISAEAMRANHTNME